MQGWARRFWRGNVVVLFVRPEPSEEARKAVEPCSLDGGTSTEKLEYITSMMSVALEDVRHVTLFVTLSLALPVLVLTQVPLREVRALPVAWRVLLVIGLAALLLAAVSYFRYVRQLHLVRMKMARCIPMLDVHRVRELWAGEAGVWRQHSRHYLRGRLLLGTGIVLVAASLTRLLVVGSP